MNGNLSVRNGVWYCVIYYKTENGEYKQKWISTGLKERGNKKEAQRILMQKLDELASLEPDQIIKSKPKDDGNNVLLLDWLSNFIYKAIQERSPSHAASALSHLKMFELYWSKSNPLLKDITAKDILEFYEYMRKTRNVKYITLKRYATSLRPAFRKAYQEKLISENPFDFMPTIKKEKHIHTFYDQNDMERLFEEIKGHPLELVFRMLAYYGFRRSEVLGIRWDAIDFTNKTISIKKKVLVVKRKIIISDTLKTASSNRTLPLIKQMEKELLKHKENIEKNRAYFGNKYNNKYLDYVFVNEYGDLILPDHLTHSFHKLLKEKGLKQIRLHDLRHSCASIMLANGVQMKQIQDWLGHSNFATTADVYSHLDFSSKLESASKIEKALKTKNTTVNKQFSEEGLTGLEEQMKALGINSIEELVQLLKKLK